MIAKQIIKAFPDFEKEVPSHNNYLNVSEFFYDSIQGEGITAGHPAAFLRLQGCILNCKYCDTRAVWRQGNPYTFEELLTLMDRMMLTKRLKEGQHLVFTGGSPLLQQEKILKFIFQIYAHCRVVPYIEIENECVIRPSPELIDLVRMWNNSPKTSNSGNRRGLSYCPDVIRYMSELSHSWFKFVISSLWEEDWKEIEEEYLPLIKRSQIILMPQGETREELERNREVVVDLAIREGVRYCSREQIVLWNKQIGV